MRISFEVAGDIINNTDHLAIGRVNATENAIFTSRIGRSFNTISMDAVGTGPNARKSSHCR